LARKASRGKYISTEAKSPHQLPGDWLSIVEKFAEEVGMDVDDTIEANTVDEKAEIEASEV
jgi:pre-mRNA-splicing factor SYF1